MAIRTQTKRKATTTNIQAPPRVVLAPLKPEFLRLPKAGEHCPYTGMGRSALNGLILPTKQNAFKPPVRSFVLRQKGAQTGIRLIDFESLGQYIRRREDKAKLQSA